MIKNSVKDSYLAFEINNAINAYNLTGKDNVFSKAIVELKKSFPSCTENEILKLVNTYFINIIKFITVINFTLMLKLFLELIKIYHYLQI